MIGLKKVILRSKARLGMYIGESEMILNLIQIRFLNSTIESKFTVLDGHYANHIKHLFIQVTKIVHYG